MSEEYELMHIVQQLLKWMKLWVFGNAWNCVPYISDFIVMFENICFDSLLESFFQNCVNVLLLSIEYKDSLLDWL